MSVIIIEGVYRTNGVSVSIPYYINQLDLTGEKIEVKFDTKIVGGEGSKFMVRHSDSMHKAIEGISMPIMESSIEGTTHTFTIDMTDDIIQNSKFITVLSNGSMGADKFELEVTNIEITTRGIRLPSTTLMIRMAGRDDNGKARAIRVNENGEIVTAPVEVPVEEPVEDTSKDNSGVILVSSTQSKPAISEMGKVLLEYDTGNVFYYDGAEWREFI